MTRKQLERLLKPLEWVVNIEDNRIWNAKTLILWYDFRIYKVKDTYALYFVTPDGDETNIEADIKTAGRATKIAWEMYVDDIANLFR